MLITCETGEIYLCNLGDAVNLIKKIQRGNYTLEESRQDLADEFADIVTYFDILAMRAPVRCGVGFVGSVFTPKKLN